MYQCDKYFPLHLCPQLKKRGFTCLDALDTNPEMLEVARSKGLYGCLICDFMGPNRLDIQDGTHNGVLYYTFIILVVNKNVFLCLRLP